MSKPETFNPANLRIAYHAVADALKTVGETCVPTGHLGATSGAMYDLGRRVTELAYELDVMARAVIKSQNGS